MVLKFNTSYEIEIVHIFNPHFIWIKICDRSPEFKNKIFQIGIIGICPLDFTSIEKSINVKYSPSTQWLLGATKQLKKRLLNETNKAYFTPCEMKDSSIFDSVSTYFGRLEVINKDNLKEDLGNFLCSSNLAHSDTILTLTFPNDKEINSIKKDIEIVTQFTLKIKCNVGQNILKSNKTDDTRTVDRSECVRKQENKVEKLHQPKIYLSKYETGAQFEYENKTDNESDYGKYHKGKKNASTVSKSNVMQSKQKYIPTHKKFEQNIQSSEERLYGVFTNDESQTNFSKNISVSNMHKDQSPKGNFDSFNYNMHKGKLTNQNFDRSNYNRRNDFQSKSNNLQNFKNNVIDKRKRDNVKCGEVSRSVEVFPLKLVTDEDKTANVNTYEKYSTVAGTLQSNIETGKDKTNFIKDEGVKSVIASENNFKPITVNINEKDIKICRNNESVTSLVSSSAVTVQLQSETDENETNFIANQAVSENDPELTRSDNECDDDKEDFLTSLNVFSKNKVDGSFVGKKYNSSLPFGFPYPQSDSGSSLGSIKSSKKAEDEVSHVSSFFSRKINFGKKTDVTALLKFEHFEVDSNIPLKMKTFVHSEHIFEKKWWSEWKDCSFSNLIRNNLSTKIQKIKPLQAVMWPSSLENSVLAVGPQNSGKTIGILISLCNLIEKINFNISTNMNRFVLIICFDIITCWQVEYACNSLLAYKKVNIHVVDNLQNSFNECAMELSLSNYNILIATPFIVTLFKHKLHPFKSLSRLSYLFLDDIDMIEQCFKDNLNELLKKCHDVREREKGDKPIRIFATSQTWCDSMKRVKQLVDRPAVCMTISQECLIYANDNLKFTFLSEKEKLENLSLLFEKTEPIRDVIIVCDKNVEIISVETMLRKLNCDVIAVTRKTDLQQVVIHWKKLKGVNVLVCTDEDLLRANLKGTARFIIHYSLPQTLSVFYHRLSTIRFQIPELVADKFEKSTFHHIFIDESSISLFSDLMDMIKRFNLSCSEEIIDKINYILTLKEREKALSGTKICDKMLSFGICHNISCSKRHLVFPEGDTLMEWIPSSGYVTFDLIYVHNVSHYTVELLEHTSIDGKKRVFDRNCNYIYDIMTYLMDKNNRNIYYDPTVGNDCVIEYKPNAFYRCEVMDVTSKVVSSRTKKIITVYLFDIGRLIESDGSNLFVLPDHFQSIKKNIVHVKLVGLIPKDMNIAWTDKLNLEVSKLLKSYRQNEGFFMRGRIVLGIYDTLWLEKVQCCVTSKLTGKPLAICDFKESILRENIGMENSEHLNVLQDMCNRCSFDLPSYTHSMKVKCVQKKVLPKPQWAHLVDDEFNIVTFGFALSLQEFFIHLSRWENMIKILSDDLEKYYKEIDYDTDNSLEYSIGDLCVVRKDSILYRARIDYKKTINGMTVYRCFFVDFGDWSDVKSNDIYDIEESFITRIPFQAIECQLAGVRPKKEYFDESVDLLFDLSFVTHDDDLLKEMYAFTISKTTATRTGGSKYIIALHDANLMLNTIFVDRELATFEELEKSVLIGVNEKFVEWKKSVAEINVNFEDSDEDLVMTESSSPVEWDQESDEESVDGDYDIYIDPILKDMLNQYKENMNEVIKEEFHCNKSQIKIEELPVDHDGEIISFEDSCIEEYLGKKRELKKKIESILMESKTPCLRWHDSDDIAYVKVEIVGVENYTLIINDSFIYFKTNVRGDKYEFDINLFSLVKEKECSHEAKGLYVFIKLIKDTRNAWTELTRGVQPQWIKHDLDFFGYDDSDEMDDLLKMKKEAEKEMLGRYYRSIEDNSDEGEDDLTNEEMHVDLLQKDMWEN